MGMNDNLKLEKLKFENRFNPNHAKDGKFAPGNGSGGASGGSGSSGSNSSGDDGSTGGVYKSAEEFEKSLGNNFDDPRLKEYSDAYDVEHSYNQGLKSNFNRSIDEDGYTATTEELLNDEKKMTQNELDLLPDYKTPAELGKEVGLNERLDIIDDLKKRKGESGSGRDYSDTIIERKRNIKGDYEKRAYSFDIEAKENDNIGVITGRPIVYNSKTDMGYFDEIIEPGALDFANLKDVRFLVNHDVTRIPLARSRNNNANSTMQLMPDRLGMAIRVNLDVENNSEARNLYSAIKRGDITGMSFMFSIDSEEWSDMESDHPTRHIRKISDVVEVSAVTFPAYEDTSISVRNKEALENAKLALESAKRTLDSDKQLIELEKAKFEALLKVR